MGINSINLPISRENFNSKRLYASSDQRAVAVAFDCSSRRYFWTDVAKRRIYSSEIDGNGLRTAVISSGIRSPEGTYCSLIVPPQCIRFIWSTIDWWMRCIVLLLWLLFCIVFQWITGTNNSNSSVVLLASLIMTIRHFKFGCIPHTETSYSLKPAAYIFTHWVA